MRKTFSLFNTKKRIIAFNSEETIWLLEIMFISVLFASSSDLFYSFKTLNSYLHNVLKKIYGVFKTKVSFCCCMKLNYLKLCINICIKMINTSFFMLIPVLLHLHKCKFAEWSVKCNKELDVKYLRQNLLW